MDWEVRLEHAESIHCLVIVQIPNLLHGSVDTPGSVQFFKSKLYVGLINTELKLQAPSTSGDGSNFLDSLLQRPTPLRGGIVSWSRKTLPKAVKWRVIQALGDHTRYYQSLGRLMRHSQKHRRIWWITIPKILSKSTRGNGMMFLLMIMSQGSPWIGKSRNWLQIWCDTVTLPIEKLMEQVTGNPCVQEAMTGVSEWRRADLLCFSMAFFPHRKQ